ncbi:hypothetical protein ACWGI1_39185 [Streptomyces sp. NPDC054835]
MKRAAVLGGSYAGLFAARVLSAHADEIVVLEADTIGADGLGRLAPRRRRPHALPAMGHAQLERWRIDLGCATAAFRRGGELGGTVIAHSTPGPASGYQPTLTEPGALASVEGDRRSVVPAGARATGPAPIRRSSCAGYDGPWSRCARSRTRAR